MLPVRPSNARSGGSTRGAAQHVASRAMPLCVSTLPPVLGGNQMEVYLNVCARMRVHIGALPGDAARWGPLGRDADAEAPPGALLGGAHRIRVLLLHTSPQEAGVSSTCLPACLPARRLHANHAYRHLYQASCFGGPRHTQQAPARAALLLLRTGLVLVRAAMLSVLGRGAGFLQVLIQSTCCYKGHQPLTMFAVRVHTHVLGRSVYMDRDAWNGTGARAAAGHPSAEAAAAAVQAAAAPTAGLCCFRAAGFRARQQRCFAITPHLQ